MSQTVLLEITVSDEDQNATSIAMAIHAFLLQADGNADVRVISRQKLAPNNTTEDGEA